MRKVTIKQNNHSARHHFNKIAKQFGKRAWVNEVDKIDVFRKAVLNAVHIDKNHRVLEVGVGSGAFASIIAVNLENYFGVDISPLMLRQAEKVIKKDNLFIGDGEDLSIFEINSFDLVCCRNVLKHASDPKKFIREMHRVCRPGGKIMLVESCAFDKEDIDFFWKITQITEPTQKPYLVIDDFLKLLKEAGLKNLNYVTFGYFDYSNNSYLDTFHLSLQAKEDVWDLYRNAPKKIKTQRKLKPLKGESGFRLYLRWIAVTGEK